MLKGLLVVFLTFLLLQCDGVNVKDKSTECESDSKGMRWVDAFDEFLESKQGDWCDQGFKARNRAVVCVAPCKPLYQNLFAKKMPNCKWNGFRVSEFQEQLKAQYNEICYGRLKAQDNTLDAGIKPSKITVITQDSSGSSSILYYGNDKLVLLLKMIAMVVAYFEQN